MNEIQYMFAWMIIGLLVLCSGGCSLVGAKDCTVPKDRVKLCLRTLNRSSNPKAPSAYRSLKREYREYQRGEVSCQEFNTFFRNHIQPVCDRLSTPDGDS